jgi:hypothetical protein
MTGIHAEELLMEQLTVKASEQLMFKAELSS